MTKLDPHLRDVDTGERSELAELDWLESLTWSCDACPGCAAWPCEGCRQGASCDGCFCAEDAFPPDDGEP